MVAEEAGHTPGGARRWLGPLFGALVSVAAGVLFFRSVPLAELGAALGRVSPAWAALGFLALSADYLLRTWRWTAMLREERPAISVGEVAPSFMASIALNNVLPFRAGDVTRAVVFPKRLGIGRAFAAATLVVERLLDLVALLGLMAIGLFLARDRLGEDSFVRDMAELGAGLALLACAGALGGILLAPRLRRALDGWAEARRGVPAGVARAGAAALGTVARLRAPRMWARVLPASALIWALEAGVFWAVLGGLGRADAVADAALLGSAGTLATLVPSTPGYIGTFHLAVQQTAALLGLAPAIGSSVAILAHAILWIGTTVVGLICLFRLGGRADGAAA